MEALEAGGEVLLLQLLQGLHLLELLQVAIHLGLLLLLKSRHGLELLRRRVCKCRILLEAHTHAQGVLLLLQKGVLLLRLP